MEKRLISAVYKRRAIWDPADDLRKNSKFLKTLWADIGMEVGVNVDDAKRKWKNLRAYFISQMRELEKPRSGSGGGVRTISPWVYYNDLLFLKNVINPLGEEKYDSLTSIESSQILSNDIQSQDIFEEIDTESDQKLPSSEINNENESDTNMISDTIFDTPETSSHPGLSKEMFYSKSNIIDYYRKRASVNNKRKMDLLESELNAEEDPNLLFFKSLLPYMKPLTPTQTLRLRSKIQQIILEEHEAMQLDSGRSSRISSAQEFMTPSYESDSYDSTSRLFSVSIKKEH